MSYEENPTIHCDVCRIARGPANHWLMYTDEDHPGVNRGLSIPPIFAVFAWNEHNWRLHGHLCGNTCASKKQNSLIDHYRESVLATM